MPRYQHDCNKCVPLGEFEAYDLYYCDQHDCPTVVARIGDDGPDYTSGLKFVGRIHAITEAHKRAITAGLLR